MPELRGRPVVACAAGESVKCTSADGFSFSHFAECERQQRHIIVRLVRLGLFARLVEPACFVRLFEFALFVRLFKFALVRVDKPIGAFGGNASAASLAEGTFFRRR